MKVIIEKLLTRILLESNMKHLLLSIAILLFSCSNDIPTEDDNSEIPSEEVVPNQSVKINTEGDVIAGVPNSNSITLSVAAPNSTQVTIYYGKSLATINDNSTTSQVWVNGVIEITLENLAPNCRYFYKLKFNGQDRGETYSFVTQRIKGSTFCFGVQGDSHPERDKEMFNSALYAINMCNVSQNQPDLYFTLGDDFSIERLIENNNINQNNVDNIYSAQRKYLGMVGCNTSLFLVNGNHEQAAKYLLDGTTGNPAVCAAIARKRFYPLPDNKGIYSGDTTQLKYVGLLKDYYAFEWGDALFVTIDPYWHSDVAVDNIAGSMDKEKDPWTATIGKEQYEWLKKTLEKSSAKYKFVFSHHIRGTGRGGIESANLYEWGGYDNKGQWQFDIKRPGWDMPIHQLFVKYGVTIFFQGHDHLFCKQELDGVIYQSVPNPADYTYRAFNSDAYTSGDVLPNSGHLNVTVSPNGVTVKYIRAYLPGDGTNGEVAYTYKIN